jgi:hypothetical protein
MVPSLSERLPCSLLYNADQKLEAFAILERRGMSPERIYDLDRRMARGRDDRRSTTSWPCN